jgi:aminoglycoside 3-N-acetyltransferase
MAMRAMMTVTQGLSAAPRAVKAMVATWRLARDLRKLGVRKGQILLVHASLSSIGWVDGGAAAVVTALRRVVGKTGTVVVSTGTEGNSKTSRAYLKRVRGMTDDEIEDHYQDMPAFDKDTTACTAGAIAEELRTTPRAVRSAHPQSSLAAIGRRAEYLMAGHDLRCHLGEDSPLAKLYELGAHILLLGVGYYSCTAFHLAEYRYTAKPPTKTYSCVVMNNGEREWVNYSDVVLDDGDFETIGKSLNDEPYVKKGYVGNAECRLISFRRTVDYARDWMAKNRI